MGKNKKISRRDFLKTSSSTALALPFLPSLFSFEAEAAGAIKPRFVAIYTKNGQRDEYWKPAVNATSSFGSGRELALSHFSATGISPILGSAFQPYQSKLTMIQGMDNVISMGHNDQQMLGHFDIKKPISTIDRVLAKSSKFYGGIIPIIDALHYGESFSYGYSGTNFSKIPTFREIQASYERIFGLGQASVLSKQSRIVERTLGFFTRVKANPKLSAADKNLIDTQASIMSDLRNRLQIMQPLTCTPPPMPTLTGTNQNELFLMNAVDMIVSAFLCNATQVASIGITNPFPIDSPNGWHGDSHKSQVALGSAPNSLAINKWIAEKFVLRLISKMDSIIEANGKSMLDNSVIYWGNEISNGNGHSTEDMPVLLAGSAGGKLRTGYLYDYRNLAAPKVSTDNAGSSSYVGRPSNQLLVTLLQAMGLSPADYETPGTKSYGVYQSGSVSRNARYSAIINEVGDPLQRLYIG